MSFVVSRRDGMQRSYTLNLRHVTPSLVSRNPRRRMCSINLPPFCHTSLPYITGFDIEITTKEFKPHAATHHFCHHSSLTLLYCNIDFVLFHNVTYYTTSLLSRIQVNTTDLLNAVCTFVATKRDIREVRVQLSPETQTKG